MKVALQPNISGVVSLGVALVAGAASIACSTRADEVTFLSLSEEAQPNISISGTIVDANGAPLPGITVRLSRAAAATTATGSDGRYAFMALHRGAYTVEPVASGCTFAPSSATFPGITSSTTANFAASGPNCGGAGGTADAGARDSAAIDGQVTDSGIADIGKIDAIDSSPADGCHVDTIACLRTRDRGGDAANVRCSQCAIDNGCLDPALQGGKCEDTMGLAPASCAAVVGTSAPTETQVCLKTLSDIFSTQCAGALGLTPCLCGSTDPEQCLAGAAAPNGPLLPEYTCDFGTTSVATMQAEFVLQTFGAGQANALVQCLGSFGCDCF